MKTHQTIPDRIWQFFCSIRLAVYTLVLLAVTSIIGTVILQNGTEKDYIHLYGPGWARLIQTLQFDDMYRAWWFLALLLILCINIIVCSIERLSATWKIIFPEKISFHPDRFRKLKNLETLIVQKQPLALVQEIETALARSVGPVIKETGDTGTLLYAEKGRWTRIGVYVVHASLLLLMIGALIGAVFGYRGSMNLNEGESSNKVRLMDRKTLVELDFDIQCNEFEVKFYDTGAPEEFRSNLTLLDKDRELLTADIRVNHPLRYKGINIFQSSYGAAPPDRVVLDILAVKDQASVTRSLRIGEEIRLSDETTVFKLEGFLPHFDFNGHELGQAFIGRITEKDGHSFQIGLPLRFPSFDKMRKGDYAFIIKDLDQKFYTGLHVTRDPGIWYVYSGFVLMIIGCWITFFMSHQSFFVEIQSAGKKGSQVHVSATANRGSQGIRLKIQKLCNTIKG